MYNATNRPDSLATSLSENTETNQFGSIHNGEVDDEHPAVLKDHPGRILMPGEHLIHQFETTALELEGDKRYLGSVSWGYEASNDESGTLHNAVLTPEPIAKVSDGVPSAEFLGAATLWNQQPVPGVGDQGETARVPLPIQ